MQLLRRVQGFQSTLIRVLSEGYKPPRIPTWWTSFEEGTLKDFIAHYKRKVRIMALFVYLLSTFYAN